MRFRSQGSALLVVLLVFHAVFLLSPIPYTLGFRARLVVPGTVILLLTIATLHDRRLPMWVVFPVVASLITSCISGVYWESWRAAFYPALFSISLLVASVATEQELRKVVSIASVILLLLILGGWIAVFLAFQGMAPLDTISGLHDRPLYLYVTTLTPTVIGNFIRPAGIYDEPGALSLVVCVFAFLRHVMGMDRRLTWCMLILGFVTFSLAHLVYVAIHFLSERRIVVAWSNLLLVLCAVIWGLSSLDIWDQFDERLLSRLAPSSVSGQLVAGDNRSGNLVRAFDVIRESRTSNLLVGVDVACIEDSIMCQRKHPGLAFNPLTPLVHYGLLISWPYYLFLAISIGVGAIRRSWWPLVGVALLFMQRPSLFNMGYSMLAALVLVSVVHAFYFKRMFIDLIWTNGRVSSGLPEIPNSA